MRDKTEYLKQIAGAISDINTKKLFESSLSIFDTLGYNTARQSRLENPTYSEFEKSYLEQNNNITDLAKFKEKAQTDNWKQIEILFQITDKEISNQADLFDAGKFDNTEIYSYLFIAIELQTGNYTRTALSDITRQVNRVFSMPVMLLFKQKDAITLSIIKRRLNKKDASRDVLEKVTLIKDINIKNPHRAHIEILCDLSLEQLKQDFPVTNFTELQTAWQKTLDLKQLNERFYQEVSTWYYYALNKIKLPIKPQFYKDDKENVKHFSVRLISRLLFSWFLKEMGLIDKRLLEIDLKNSTKLLKYKSEEKEFLKGNSYYRHILQNIFFASLNTPQNERKSFLYESNISIDTETFKKIPYLNGGLFEKLEEDNCNDRIDDSKIKIPNELFFAEEIKVRVDKKEKETKGLNKIFEHYKFTVDENTSFEEEIALDPELLGLIFENLLAEIDPNDAISKSARKATGSFYTPRKIIDYMVNESLLLYFINFFNRQKADAKKLKDLVYYEKCTDNDKAFRKLIVQAIDEIKVLDPACGSGAFPMGMLHKLVRILKVVDDNNLLWIEKQVNRLPIELRERTKQELIRHETNYARKLGIIRNSIYSVDIQPMAVMISKLRFFISLLIEQDINLKDAKHNYHISPLPNLETKIICANTLKDTSIEQDMFTAQTINTLIEAKEEYYQNNYLTAKQKNTLLTTIVESLHSVYPDFAFEVTGKKIKDHAGKELLNKKYLEEWFKHGNLAAPFFSMDVFYPELKGSGFDIVIGNPPYGGDKIPDEVKKNLGLGSKDPYGAFIARFLGNGYSSDSGGKPTPLKTNGILSYIVSDTFMTIKSHLQLRKQMVKNKIHKMIRVHPGTFKATVNTAVILCEKLSTKDVFVNAVEDSHKCTMADLTTVSIHDNHDRFLELLYQTTEAEVDGQIEKKGDKLPVLRMEGDNWTSESCAEYAVYTYPQNLINTNSNLPFFVASPKLFAFMNDNNDQSNRVKTETKEIEGKRVQVRTIDMNGKEIEVVKLGDIAEVKVGLQTGDNDSYLFQNPEARGNYRSIEEYKEYLLTEEDLDKIRNNENLRLEVINKGISKGTKKSKRYFGGRFIIPYDKGGASDARGGWLPNYYVPTDYFIDWSEWAVKRMKTYTIAQRIIDKKENKTIRKHYKQTACAVFRSPGTYFTPSISFSRTGVYSPTFRIGAYSCFDTEGSMIFQNVFDEYSLLGLLATKYTRFQLKNFIGHTVHCQVDELKEFITPNIINDKLKNLVDEIIRKQKQNLRYDYASNEQIEIDHLVYEAYGLNQDDITEVENWYTRRYPNLKQTKKSGLKHEVVEKLKQQRSYFSYEEIQALLEKEKIEITPSSLKSYVFELTKNKVIFNAGKGWYSILEKDFILNKNPVQKVIRRIKKEFPLLEFSCWSTEQLNPFTHHLLAKFITFVYTDMDYISNTADILEKGGFSVFQNPTKQEIEKSFKITEKTVILRPAISKQPDKGDSFSPIEKILVDFLIENEKIGIMESSEAEDVVKAALNSGKINISGLYSYANRRKLHIPETINQVQNNIKAEIVD